jgi:hypothetical protein
MAQSARHGWATRSLVVWFVGLGLVVGLAEAVGGEGEAGDGPVGGVGFFVELGGDAGGGG